MYIVYKYIPDITHIIEYEEMIDTKKMSKKNYLCFSNGNFFIKWIYHLIVTLGHTKIWTLASGKKIIHYSFYTSYCYKFSFMGKKDYVIGPCWTAEEFRGNRIYPVTINKIAYNLCKDDNRINVYLLVRPENKQSTNSIKHTKGWIAVGRIEKTRFKNYKKCNWDGNDESAID